jgi:UDP-N-acetyl-D-galactosamine dehydrogenase
MHEYGIKTITNYLDDSSLSLSKGSLPKWGVVVLAVAHNEFLKLNFEAHKEAGAVIYDVKGILEKELTDGRL